MTSRQTLLRVAKGARPRSGHAFASIEDALVAFRAGRMLIVVDDEDRENEGDLTIAASAVTPEAINFMARLGRGLICLPMTGQRLDELDIPLMVNQNTARFDTAFCVSIEARFDTSTGISASDRAATVRAAIDPATRPDRPVTAGAHVPASRAAREACSSGRDRPRRPSTWRGSRDCTRRASSARS